MISFSFMLSNPFAKKPFDNVFTKFGKVTKNKSYEVCLNSIPGLLISSHFGWDFRQSHAGISLSIGLFGYEFSFSLTDNRHWDYENDCWEECGVNKQ